jgi:hypothetical protein
LRRSEAGVAAAHAQLLGGRDVGVVAVALTLHEREEDGARLGAGLQLAARLGDPLDVLVGEGDERRLELALVGGRGLGLGQAGARVPELDGAGPERLGQRRDRGRRVGLLLEGVPEVLAGVVGDLGEAGVVEGLAGLEAPAADVADGLVDLLGLRVAARALPPAPITSTVGDSRTCTPRVMAS